MTKPNQLSFIGPRPKCPMSEYSASDPVTASTTEPSARKANHPSITKKLHRVPGVERPQDLRDAARSATVPSAAMTMK